jgi:hypothetical protein
MKRIKKTAQLSFTSVLIATSVLLQPLTTFAGEDSEPYQYQKDFTSQGDVGVTIKSDIQLAFTLDYQVEIPEDIVLVRQPGGNKSYYANEPIKISFNDGNSYGGNESEMPEQRHTHSRNDVLYHFNIGVAPDVSVADYSITDKSDYKWKNLGNWLTVPTDDNHVLNGKEWATNEPNNRVKGYFNALNKLDIIMGYADARYLSYANENGESPVITVRKQDDWLYGPNLNFSDNVEYILKTNDFSNYLVKGKELFADSNENALTLDNIGVDNYKHYSNYQKEIVAPKGGETITELPRFNNNTVMNFDGYSSLVNGGGLAVYPSSFREGDDFSSTTYYGGIWYHNNEFEDSFLNGNSEINAFTNSSSEYEKQELINPIQLKIRSDEAGDFAEYLDVFTNNYLNGKPALSIFENNHFFNLNFFIEEEAHYIYDGIAEAKR